MRIQLIIVAVSFIPRDSHSRQYYCTVFTTFCCHCPLPSTLHGCRLSATELFRSPQLVFRTNHYTMSRPYHNYEFSAVVWRHNLSTILSMTSCSAHANDLRSILGTIITVVAYLHNTLPIVKWSTCWQLHIQPRLTPSLAFGEDWRRFWQLQR